MQLWVAFPTNNVKRSDEATARWHAKGFNTLVVVNKELHTPGMRGDFVFKVDAYEGYYRAMNFACQTLFHAGHADIVVCAGDRFRPPENFYGHDVAAAFALHFPLGRGVMFPTTGFTTSQKDRAASVNRACVWIGRRFWQEAYGGTGPYYDGYFQYMGNDELRAVAAKMEAAWEHAGIVHVYDEPPEEDFYQKVNRESYHEKDKALFEKRKEDGFPGAEPGRIVACQAWPEVDGGMAPRLVR